MVCFPGISLGRSGFRHFVDILYGVVVGSENEPSML